MLFNWVTRLLSLVVGIHTVLSRTVSLTTRDDKTSDILPRATSPDPIFLAYTDAYDGETGPPEVSKIKGYNVIALAFLLLDGAWDKAQEWTQLSASQRSSILSQYHMENISLIVSLFGSTDAPTTSGADPVQTANTMAAWVIEYELDGVDVDYEDFSAFDSGKAENWLGIFTRQLRSQLPQGSYILTHAPVAPWFSPGYKGGGYLQVHLSVGSLIDWYNIQFYNQGPNEYTTCENLLMTSSNNAPQSALFQIAARGVPLSKLVIGKPASPSDADSGVMSTSLLADCLEQAKQKDWNAGLSVWQLDDASSSWITSVRSKSWPV